MRRGMTLFEVLVALAIATVVFAAVFFIYRAATATAIHQHENERVAFAPRGVFDQLWLDVGGMMPASLTPTCAIRVVESEKMGAMSSEFSFGAWRSISRTEPWDAAEHIEWRIEGEPGKTHLVRTSIAFAGPRSVEAVTNTYLDGIRIFHIQIHDGKEWRSKWPPEDDKDNKVRPRTVRVEIELDEKSNNARWSTDIFVPIGMVVTSRIDRTVVTPSAPPRTRTR
jgi:prepilin-type N-terminal cleavage/methylation domain-containing protein